MPKKNKVKVIIMNPGAFTTLPLKPGKFGELLTMRARKFKHGGEEIKIQTKFVLEDATPATPAFKTFCACLPGKQPQKHCPVHTPLRFAPRGQRF